MTHWIQERNDLLQHQTQKRSTQLTANIYAPQYVSYDRISVLLYINVHVVSYNPACMRTRETMAHTGHHDDVVVAPIYHHDVNEDDDAHDHVLDRDDGHVDHCASDESVAVDGDGDDYDGGGGDAGDGGDYDFFYGCCFRKGVLKVLLLVVVNDPLKR